MKSIRFGMLSLALVASFAAIGCVAGSGDSSEGFALAEEGDLGSAEQALVSGGYYIQNVNSQKVLDIFGGSTNIGAPVIQWPWAAGANQQFTIAPTDDGYYTITSVKTGMCLDVFGGNTKPGANIDQWTCGQNLNQKFSIESVSAGVYRIRPLNGGLCLTVYGDSTADGYAIVQDTCANKTSQQFSFIAL